MCNGHVQKPSKKRETERLDMSTIYRIPAAVAFRFLFAVSSLLHFRLYYSSYNLKLKKRELKLQLYKPRLRLPSDCRALYSSLYSRGLVCLTFKSQSRLLFSNHDLHDVQITNRMSCGRGAAIDDMQWEDLAKAWL